jgi:hypothetical protein
MAMPDPTSGVAYCVHQLTCFHIELFKRGEERRHHTATQIQVMVDECDSGDDDHEYDADQL